MTVEQQAIDILRLASTLARDDDAGTTYQERLATATARLELSVHGKAHERAWWAIATAARVRGYGPDDVREVRLVLLDAADRLEHPQVKFRCSTCHAWTEGETLVPACPCGGELQRLPGDAVGFIVSRWIQDDDPGDEDPSLPTRWVVLIEMPPFHVMRALHEVVVTGKVSV